MATSLIQIPTADGPCTTELATPDGVSATDPRPAVIVLFDAAGLRPAQTHIAERIASMGYMVFQPDLFFRSPPLADLIGEVTLAKMREVFANPELRDKFVAGYYGPALDYAKLETTVGAVLDHIASRSDCRGGVGTTGYCMGANASFRAATMFGTRIAATAGFHPGMLVTDAHTSPHLRAKDIKSRLYLGPAIGDLVAENEAKLRAELDAGGVHYTIEHYDAKHGYAVDDSDAYDQKSAEKHYAALASLFGETLNAAS